MKRIAKDIFVHKLDKYNYEIFREWYQRDEEGRLKTDGDGNPKKGKDRIGYYSNFDRAWSAILDLAASEYMDNDLRGCRAIIDEASENMKQFIIEQTRTKANNKKELV